MTVMAQRSFARGEISPDLWARTDLASYLTGLRTCRNFIVKKVGGAQNRPGENYVTTCKDGGPDKLRLIPFIFSKDEAYCLQFGNQYLRVIRNQVEQKVPFGNSAAVAAISINANSTITAPAPLAINTPFTLYVNKSLNPAYSSLDGSRFFTQALVGGTTYHWTDSSNNPVDTSTFPAFNTGTADDPGATLIVQAYVLTITQAAQAVIELNLLTSPANFANTDIVLSGQAPAGGLDVHYSGQFRLGALLNPGGVAPWQYELLSRQKQHVDSRLYPAFTGGGLSFIIYRPYEIATPYTTADLEDLVVPPQVADTMILTHAQHPPMILARYADANWNLTQMPLGSSVLTPVAPAIAGHYTSVDIDTLPGVFNESQYLNNWFVSAVDSFGVESIISAALHVPTFNGVYTGAFTGDFLTSVDITWTAPPNGGPYTYRIYRYNGHTLFGTADQVLPMPAGPGQLGLVGTSVTTNYTDVGTANIDPTQLPLTSDINPFGIAGSYPSCASFYQNRLMFGKTDNAPQTIWGSVVGDFKNFDVSTPLKDTDSFNFTLTSNQLMGVNYMLYINPGFLLVFTDNGEWAIFGDASGTLSPGNFNARQQSYYGCAKGLKVIPIGKSALFVQASQTVIRDLSSQMQVGGVNNVGYDGDELTIFSQHLFENHSIMDWDYQMLPESVVWAAREDGILLGMTYVKNQQILAWHRHDTAGNYENVCCIPEGNESAVYVTVLRQTPNGPIRFIERMANRALAVPTPQGNGLFDSGGVVDCVFMDGALTYDGRNTDPTKTMTLSGGTSWNYQDQINLHYSGAPFFTAAMVGEIIVLLAPDKSLLQCKIIAVVNNVNATVNVEYQSTTGTVPVSAQNVAISTWAKAVSTLFGLWSLEGQQVSVLADGNVVSSPNEWQYLADGVTKKYLAGDPLTVANGQLSLPKPKCVVHVGLPFISDLEMLSIDNPQGEALVAKKKVIGQVNLWLRESRGVWTGSALPDPAKPGNSPTGMPNLSMYPLKIRSTENYQNPIELVTRPVVVNLGGGNWGLEAAGCVRQLSPLPLTVTGIFPEGIFS